MRCWRLSKPRQREKRNASEADKRQANKEQTIAIRTAGADRLAQQQRGCKGSPDFCIRPIVLCNLQGFVGSVYHLEQLHVHFFIPILHIIMIDFALKKTSAGASTFSGIFPSIDRSVVPSRVWRNSIKSTVNNLCRRSEPRTPGPVSSLSLSLSLSLFSLSLSLSLSLSFSLSLSHFLSLYLFLPPPPSLSLLHTHTHTHTHTAKISTSKSFPRVLPTVNEISQ